MTQRTLRWPLPAHDLVVLDRTGAEGRTEFDHAVNDGQDTRFSLEPSLIHHSDGPRHVVNICFYHVEYDAETQPHARAPLS